MKRLMNLWSGISGLIRRRCFDFTGFESFFMMITVGFISAGNLSPFDVWFGSKEMEEEQHSSKSITRVRLV